MCYNTPCMLIDEVTISIKAGNGGNGAVHFIRNARTAKGGPDGGNAGNGGSVYFVGVDDIAALREFRFKKNLEAETGINGGRQNLYGRNGEDLLVKVPFGTIIIEEETGKRYTITRIVPKILLAKGGKGGRGNNEFKSATNQTPKYAEPGTPGEEKTLHLELKLIADVGLIGIPNAGKSSLLQELTNATPKIANYPFTTLEPNLGMMGTIILADIPGLIEGASSGKGLGIKFLRHIERTKLLVHCIACDNTNILETYQTVRKELEEYNKEILSKPEIILLTKSDLVDEKELKEKMKLFKKQHEKILIVSIYDDKSIKDLMHMLQETLKPAPLLSKSS
jgi:GTP-binding protein